MLKKIVASALCAFALCAHGPAAAEPASRASIERLFSLLDMQKMMDAAYAQTEPMVQKLASEVPPEQRELFRKHFDRMQAVVREELGWEALKGPIIDAYSRVYSQEEIDQLLAFYASPVGQKMIAKTPELMRVTQELVMGRMEAMMGRMKAIERDMKAEAEQQGTKPR